MTVKSLHTGGRVTVELFFFEEKTAMKTSAPIKEEILQLLEVEVDQWLATEKSITDGYTYETKFMEVAQRVNRILLTKSMGNLPKDRNKKNFRPVLGR